jgi:N-acyl homoserine lactone hydrolase
MELIAVPTGVKDRVAAYAYRGGSVFDRRDFHAGAALIKHAQGDLLVHASCGSRPPTRWRAAGYDFGRLKAILLPHGHWDHMSGLPDLPGPPIMVTGRDKALFGKIAGPRARRSPGLRAPVQPDPVHLAALRLRGRTYLGFARSHGVHGDGSVVCVPAPGHTPGSRSSATS